MENIKNSEIRPEREKFTDEIAAYGKLVSRIKSIEDFKINTESPKASLAFLIEEMKEKNPEGWQNDAENLKKEIDEKERTEGKAGAVWLIAEKIDSAYIDFLSQKIKKIEDKELKRKVMLIKQVAENNAKFRRENYEKGKMGGFGGVSLSYIPQWYYLTK